MSFLHTINKDERALLRNIVKRVHLAYHPEQFQTDREADKVISIIAPEVIERMIKFGKDNKVDNI
jgi:hypothetical protein